jgi:phage shock protein C
MISAPRTSYRLYRDSEHRWIAGVCAGIADYLGVDPVIVRVVTVLGLIFFSAPTLITYAVLALVLKPRPPVLYASPAEEEFWRGVATAPADTPGMLREKFRGLEKRLGRMEALVTSGEFELRRGFRDIGG